MLHRFAYRIRWFPDGEESRPASNLGYFMGVKSLYSGEFEYPEHYRSALTEITGDTIIDHPRCTKKYSDVSPESVIYFIEAQALENGDKLSEVLTRYEDAEDGSQLRSDISSSLTGIDQLTGSSRFSKFKRKHHEPPSRRYSSSLSEKHLNALEDVLEEKLLE